MQSLQSIFDVFLRFRRSESKNVHKSIQLFGIGTACSAHVLPSPRRSELDSRGADQVVARSDFEKTYIWYKAVQDSYLRLYVSNKKFSCQGNQIQSNYKLRFQLLLLLEIPIIIILFKFTFIKNTLHTCHIINPCLQSSLQLIEAERKIKKKVAIRYTNINILN